ncbi:HpcH/HpaI aldolase/citrate lyase family protein [Methylophaga sp. OBS4]|uniref:HpcH/HpaI aldolase/citrate lyase family protein n=1 Tax=Methylophaga sp. OBS4 TaxID=2991935 RepID=UPI0022524FF3|nr:aldolase/citrate lyase family protein [Methylophaga sp. OBS4]MCX4186501.1 aldolase/citrate lyase family protein [Methylophaga sp. OBS4]
MTSQTHPSEALFDDEQAFPIIPSCEHFAGSEKLILKALSLQDTLGPIFDITCDCEDGAAAGAEREHAEMIVRVLDSQANKHKMAGARIHDYTHYAWRQDVDILVAGLGNIISYITIPKVTKAAQAAKMIAYIQQVARDNGISREIPVHVLIETHGALRDVFEIAALPWLQVLDFGLMDFVSGHHGAIAASAMRSPGQFEHRLLARAKTEVVAAALANGVVPAHNVTLDLKNTEITYADAYRARHEFGFMRMWSIYPTQITAIVDAMKPDYSEVLDAANILLAAQQADWGPLQYEGELHDRATYRYFWELLQTAKKTGVALPEKAEQAFF